MNISAHTFFPSQLEVKTSVKKGSLFYSCVWKGFQSWHFCILFLTTTELLVLFFFFPSTILCQRVLCTAFLTQDIFYKTSMMVFLCWATVYELQQISHSSHSKTHAVAAITTLVLQKPACISLHSIKYLQGTLYLQMEDYELSWGQLPYCKSHDIFWFMLLNAEFIPYIKYYFSNQCAWQTITDKTQKM